MSGGVRVDKALLRSRVSVRTKLGAGAGESHFAKVIDHGRDQQVANSSCCEEEMSTRSLKAMLRSTAAPAESRRHQTSMIRMLEVIGASFV